MSAPSDPAPAIGGTAEAPARVIAAQLDWPAAWQRVYAKAGMPGVDGIAVTRFARTTPRSLAALEAQLACGQYQPVPLRLATMSKKLGGLRVLLVPAVRDRVAQTAVAAWLARRWNPRFDQASFAYRPGRGVHSALRYLRELYESGFRWVFDADIRSCFDSIDHSLLFARLAEDLGAGSPVATWVRAWTAAPVWTGFEVRRIARGIPQGSPLSPLVANFFLDGFDRSLRAAGIRFVRYADDFLVLARSPFDLSEHRRIVASTLSALGLELNEEKTRSTTFDQWFRFVGAEIQGEKFLVPFEQRKAKLKATYVAERMPRTLLAAWRAGTLREGEPLHVSDVPRLTAKTSGTETTAHKPSPLSVAPGAREYAALERLKRGW